MAGPISLFVWWMDDGSITANGRKGVLRTDSFNQDELKIIVRYLKITWAVKTKIGKVKIKTLRGETKEYYRLWIRSTEELKKLLRIILPFLKVASMIPKVLLLYKDSQLQQRWISEVSEITGFSQKTVKTYLLKKKSRWKHFRE